MDNRYLFRAKRIDNGEWVEGNLITDEKDHDHAYIGFLFGVIDGAVHDTDIIEVDQSTICQCTGLKDMNGKLIWENDILMSHGNKNDLSKAVFGEFFVIDADTLENVERVTGWHYEIIPTDALSKCEPFCLSMPLTEEYIKRCEFEAVGNIFDNPELMEQEG